MKWPNVRHWPWWIARKLKFRTEYLVAWSYSVPGSITTGCHTLTLYPWLTTRNYREVVDYIKDSGNLPSSPVVISITRIGH